MKKPSRFLRVFGVAGLLLSLFAATLAPAVAQGNGDDDDGLDNGRDFIDFGDADFDSASNTIFYPWVANGEDFGLGESQTSISVQNLEDEDTTIFIYVGNSADDEEDDDDGNGGFELETTAFLSRFAAKTFTADQLNIAEGSGAPVAVVSFSEAVGDELFPDVIAGSVLTETVVLLSKPENVTGDFTQVFACVVNASSETTNPGFGVPVGFVVAADFTFEGEAYFAADDDDGDGIDDIDDDNVFRGSFTQEDLQDILEDANSAGGDLVNPFGGLINDADCDDVRIAGTAGSGGVPGTGINFDSVAIGGVAKQAVEGDSLPSTTSADTAVSGYNALNGAELARFGEQTLPIVQTNCGPGGCWDSVIRVANLRNENNAVTIEFFPADNAAGSLDTGFQVQELVDAGDTVSINLSDFVPEGWVGSAHILSDGTTFSMVDRYKVGYDMWITNTSSSADFENLAQVEGAQGDYVLFAPHVLLDYFGWNTGINVANLADQDNNVSIQYFNLFGNATQVLNQRIAVDGMTYFYDPSQPAQDGNVQDQTGDDVDNGDDNGTDDNGDDTNGDDTNGDDTNGDDNADDASLQQANESGDANANIVGSALIWSDFPVAAVVDATKYPETDPNGGPDVFQATSYSATQNVFEFQAVPLFQKGNPVDGMGDTSGVNIMNPNSGAATVNVFFVNPSGFNAQNFGASSVTIPGFANGFVYSMTQRNLPNGFTGAIQVVSNLPVAAVSANVNYAVDGDGSAIFNAFNPCGFFRVAVGDCNFGNPFDSTDGSFTKTFVDELGDPVEGVGFSIVSTSDEFGFQRDGFSQEDGSLTMENIPVGEFELFVDSVPEGFNDIDSDEVQDTFTVGEGEDVTLTNTLTFDSVVQGVTKTVVATGTGTDDDADGEIDAGTGVTLEGVDVVVFEQVGTDSTGGAVLGDIVFEGQTDASGQVGDNLPTGDFVLCLFDADGEATTSDGETVGVDLGTTAEGSCAFGSDEFTVDDDVVSDMVNEVDTLGTVEVVTEIDGVPTTDDVDVIIVDLTDETATCDDLVAGDVIADIDGTIVGEGTSVDGSVTIIGVVSGTFCVIADIDGDGVIDEGETSEVVVENNTSITIELDLLVETGNVEVITEIDGVPTTDDVDVIIVDIDCGTLIEGGLIADIDGTLIVGEGTSVDGSVTITGLIDGAFCVIADIDGDGVIDAGETAEVTAEVGTTVIVELDVLVTTGNIDVITTTDGEITAGVDFEVFAGTCDDLALDFASGVSLGTGTTDEFGELTLTNFAAGEVCVVADLNGDLVIDETDVTADATVEAGVVTDVVVDLLVTTGNIDATALQIDGSVAADVNVALFAGDCATVDVATATALDTTITDADGEATFANQTAGSFCVVADFDGDGFDELDVQVDATVAAAGTVAVTLQEV